MDQCAYIPRTTATRGRPNLTSWPNSQGCVVSTVGKTGEAPRSPLIAESTSPSTSGKPEKPPCRGSKTTITDPCSTPRGEIPRDSRRILRRGQGPLVLFQCHVDRLAEPSSKHFRDHRTPFHRFHIRRTIPCGATTAPWPSTPCTSCP